MNKFNQETKNLFSFTQFGWNPSICSGFKILQVYSIQGQDTAEWYTSAMQLNKERKKETAYHISIVRCFQCDENILYTSELQKVTR